MEKWPNLCPVATEPYSSFRLYSRTVGRPCIPPFSSTDLGRGRMLGVSCCGAQVAAVAADHCHQASRIGVCPGLTPELSDLSDLAQCKFFIAESLTYSAQPSLCATAIPSRCGSFYSLFTSPLFTPKRSPSRCGALRSPFTKKRQPPILYSPKSGDSIHHSPLNYSLVLGEG